MSRLKLIDVERLLQLFVASDRKFRARPEQEQKEARRKAEQARTKLWPDKGPLRTLYVDLTFHDTMIANARAPGQGIDRKHVRTIMQNKIGLQRMIQSRELAGEELLPVERTRVGSLAQFASSLVDLVPVSMQAGVAAIIVDNGSTLTEARLPALVRRMQVHFASQKNKSIEAFRSITQITDLCLSRLNLP